MFKKWFTNLLSFFHILYSRFFGIHFELTFFKLHRTLIKEYFPNYGLNSKFSSIISDLIIIMETLNETDFEERTRITNELLYSLKLVRDELSLIEQ